VVGLVRRQAHARVDVPRRRGRVRRAAPLRGASTPCRASTRARAARHPAERGRCRARARGPRPPSPWASPPRPTLADYWRMKRAQVRQAILELEEAGDLIPRDRAGPGASAAAPPPPGCTATPDAPAGSTTRQCSRRSTRGVFRPAHRATVRLPLPHRDLHARARSQVRLLLAAGAHRRRRGPAASTSRTTEGRRAARAVGVGRARCSRRDGGAAGAGV
jgi:hypothetical protein